jgi:hypothetical protein
LGCRAVNVVDEGERHAGADAHGTQLGDVLRSMLSVAAGERRPWCLASRVSTPE